MERNAFFPSGTQKVPMRPHEEADGRTYVYAVAHAALTKLTPYFVIANEYGNVTEALPSSGKYGYVGVPLEAVASGAIAKLQIGGYIEDMITASLSMAVGHGMTCNTAAVADIGADYSGAAGEFAVAVEATTSSTTQTAILVPERIITI